MKVVEATRVIDRSWVRKPAGFKVHYQVRTEEGIIEDYIPGPNEKPMSSDVVAWRMAWKLGEVSKTDDPEYGNGKIMNIYVVDDQGNPVRYYATGEYCVFNPYDESDEK